MLVGQKVSRRSFFQGWTPGLVLGVLFYLLAVLGLHTLGAQQGRDLIPCFFYEITSLPCPLCGGTRATLLLSTGHLIQAFLLNPLVTFSLLIAFAWALSWMIFGFRLRFRISDKTLAVAILLLFFINWVYVAFILS